MPNKYETLSKRKQLLGHNLSIAYRDPVKIVRGAMQYLYDDRGQQFLDAYNNVAHAEPCHPKVVEAGQRQMSERNTNPRFLPDQILTEAEKLLPTMPASM